MPRLIHLAGYTPPQGGSFIPFMRSALVEAKARGWEVEAVFPEAARGRDWLGQFEREGIPVRFAFGSRRELTEWIASAVGEQDVPTILHTHFTVYDIAAAQVARRHRHVTVYWHVHTVLFRKPWVVAINAVKFSLLGRNVARILCPAQDMADAIVRRLASRRKVWVFPSPVDADAFPFLTEEERAGFREALGVDEASRGLLHFGRDWRVKGGDLFLDALADLRAEGRRVLGLINQGGERARKEADARGLASEVRMIDLDPNVRRQYGAADVLVAPSRGEGMPFTVVECLCSGTPVVASNLAGHRFLGDQLDACAITRRDPHEIAAAVGRFLDMPEQERGAACARAREWIVANLDVGAAARRLIEDYEHTLDAETTAPRERAA
jgi:glycosyltransferase involved in cell wall biosynthesis